MADNIQKYDFKAGLPQEFEIINLDLLFTELSEQINKPHRAEFYQILWFQEGTPIHVIDFNSIQIKSNSLLFIKKGNVQIFDSKNKFRGKAILFTDNFFCKSKLHTLFLHSTILFNDLLSLTQIDLSESDIDTIFMDLETESENLKDEYQTDILRNYLHNLLLYSERERKKQGFIELENDVDLEYAFTLKELLEENFIAHKDVAYYANKLNISTKRLNQTTSKIFGKTPKSIISDRVLLESKRLLAHTNGSVKEISYILGFEEPTNFIKYFKKHTKETPNSFRERYI